MGVKSVSTKTKIYEKRNSAGSLIMCLLSNLKITLTSDPRAEAVSSLTMLASSPQVFETKWEENSSFSLLRLFLTGSTTITSIFSRTSRKLVIPEIFSSLYDTWGEKSSKLLLYFLHMST